MTVTREMLLAMRINTSCGDYGTRDEDKETMYSLCDLAEAALDARGALAQAIGIMGHGADHAALRVLLLHLAPEEPTDV